MNYIVVVIYYISYRSQTTCTELLAVFVKRTLKWADYLQNEICVPSCTYEYDTCILFTIHNIIKIPRGNVKYRNYRNTVTVTATHTQIVRVVGTLSTHTVIEVLLYSVSCHLLYGQYSNPRIHTHDCTDNLNYKW